MAASGIAAVAWPARMAIPDNREEARLMLRNSVGPLVVTVISFVLVGWSLYYVFHNLGVAPTISNGTVTANPLQSAKDVLTVVVPFASAAIGFWFGADGKVAAQNQAQQAQQQASDERDRATRADQQKGAVLQAAPDAKALLDRAKDLVPEAFS
jgi:hypothetical protein